MEFLLIIVLAVLGAAFIVGGYFGSLFAVNLSDLWLKRVFGVVMIIVGVKMTLGK